MKTHKNIPVFIPHLGCPNDCAFCNQRTISGTREFRIKDVRSIIDRALSTIDTPARDVQIAFFGGSFTGIDRGEMLYLLGLGKEYVDSGAVGSIRISTRPDYISPEILDILAAHRVTDIELGIQSLSDRVLEACGRGHTAARSLAACEMITSHGAFSLVGQMMTALPCSSPEDDVETARGVVAAGASGARIYPTMVFSGTRLEQMTRDGTYTPPSLDALIGVTADVFGVFAEAGVEVIRIGLSEGEGLHGADGIVAGAYHPAMGELVVSEYYRRGIERDIAAAVGAKTAEGKGVCVLCAPGETSKIIGQKQCNKLYLIRKYGIKMLKVIEKSEIMRYNYKILII